MNKSTSTRLGQILLDKGLVTAAQLDIAIKEQQKRRQLLDPFDENLGVNSSLGEILIELGFIDRLQLRRGLNWQLMLRKMAIVMSFCAPLMTVSYGAAAAGTTPRPAFTTGASSSSVAPKPSPGFTKTSSSSLSSAASSVRSSSLASSKASSQISSINKSSAASSKASGIDTTAPKAPEKITVITAAYDRVQLTWIAATDNVAVIRYKIYRDQVQIDTVEATENSYFDFSVAAERTYVYGISAGDAAGNWSEIKSVLVQTAAAPLDSGYRVSSSSSSIVNQGVSSNSSTSLPSSPTSSSSISSTSVSSAPSSLVSSASSKPVSSSSVSSKSTSSVASSISSSKASSSVATSKGTTVAGPVNFNWTAPTLRENGNILDITEVGGYELRYRKVNENEYSYITINDAWKNYYNFSWLEGTYIFQIAAYDKNGLYSNFVDLAPH